MWSVRGVWGCEGVKCVEVCGRERCGGGVGV